MNPFINIKKFSGWDIITISLYFALTIFLYLANFPSKVDWLFGYTLGTHLFLYFFNYKSLRNFAVWLIWLGFSFIHLYLYFQFVDLPELQIFGTSTANGLRFTWILLFVYQVLRFLSLKIRNLELVSLSRGKKDIWDKRNITFFDVTLFFVYIIIMMILNFI